MKIKLEMAADKGLWDVAFSLIGKATGIYIPPVKFINGGTDDKGSLEIDLSMGELKTISEMVKAAYKGAKDAKVLSIISTMKNDH